VADFEIVSDDRRNEASTRGHGLFSPMNKALMEGLTVLVPFGDQKPERLRSNIQSNATNSIRRHGWRIHTHVAADGVLVWAERKVTTQEAPDA
jgi:hypothetical protein